MIDSNKKAIAEVAMNFGVKKLVLFGSALTSFEEARDIDIACGGLSGKQFLRFGAKIEEMFNKTVDLIMLEENNKFTEMILQEGEIIYEL